jgi:hypothetical protein
MAVQTSATDIHLRSDSAMGLQSTTPFSVSAWINCNWNGGAIISFVGIYGPVTDTPVGAPVTAMQIGTKTGTGDLVCWTWGGANLVASAAGAMTSFSNTWVFIAYTFDGTTHRLYRNGAELANSTNSQISGYLNQVYINGYPGSVTSEVGSFQVDQYALYRRTLSASEIQTMYNSAGFRHGIINNIICRYDFDELAQSSSISSVIDLSGNGHNLGVVGVGTAMTYTYPATYANSNIRTVQ